MTGSDGNEFLNCRVHDGGTVGFDNAIYIQSADNLVENCEIYNWAGAAVQMYGGNINNNTIRYNYIHNTSGGIPAGVPNSVPTYSYVNGRRSQGIIVYNGTNNRVYGNVIANLRIPSTGIVGGSASILVGGGASNTKIYNNTVYNSGIGIYTHPGTTITSIKNNIVYGNSYADLINDGAGMLLSNNLTTNPNFVNPLANDFRLQSTSPAIDKGSDLSTEGILVDASGRSRPQGSGYDIGAYEY
jgi:hypothetical protein